ncbi:1164_t:CDS:1 [Paraglomus brasilianum]|uniref:1164_t:CDS:1 n=1 Tax=Paraglomus brasilianum TaxID=144538 RepID=A0A9N9AX42_9GLOM|nr:1164_t:CDS:1 [Paraglomus brasilianum]
MPHEGVPNLQGLRKMISELHRQFPKPPTTLSIEELIESAKKPRSKSIPRPQNSFMLYRKDVSARSMIASTNTGTNTGGSRGIAKNSEIASKEWKKVVNDKKQHDFWKCLYEIVNYKHQIMYPKYKYQPKKGAKNRRQRRKKGDCNNTNKNNTISQLAIPLISDDQLTETLNQEGLESGHRTNTAVISSNDFEQPQPLTQSSSLRSRQQQQIQQSISQHAPYDIMVSPQTAVNPTQAQVNPNMLLFPSSQQYHIIPNWTSYIPPVAGSPVIGSSVTTSGSMSTQASQYSQLAQLPLLVDLSNLGIVIPTQTTLQSEQGKSRKKSGGGINGVNGGAYNIIDSNIDKSNIIFNNPYLDNAFPINGGDPQSCYSHPHSYSHSHSHSSHNICSTSPYSLQPSLSNERTYNGYFSQIDPFLLYYSSCS